MDEPTRRKLLGGATLGAAAAVAAPGAAQPPQARGGKTNPRDKHPKPPFPSQSQPWPGLAAQMTPRPDQARRAMWVRAGFVGAGR